MPGTSLLLVYFIDIMDLGAFEVRKELGAWRENESGVSRKRP